MYVVEKVKGIVRVKFLMNSSEMSSKFHEIQEEEQMKQNTNRVT